MGSQLVANGGDSEGLFRAAVLSCGSLLPTGDISYQQPSFDSVVAHVGCGNAVDKLDCLRGVPPESLTAAAAQTPNINLFSYGVCVGGSYTSRSISGMLTRGCQGVSALQWFPHADGTFLQEPVRDAVLAGRIADVPFIAGQLFSQYTTPYSDAPHRRFAG